MVRRYEKSFVAADIPGLIEGAANGEGLGHDFLRHIERTRMLCHVVDISGMEGRDPYEDFKKINAELKQYSKKLASLPQIVVLNKCDVYGAEAVSYTHLGLTEPSLMAAYAARTAASGFFPPVAALSK